LPPPRQELTAFESPILSFVGYAYQQITDDSGQNPALGGFRSRVLGIGPQLGYTFPVGDMQGFLGLKAYGEFRQPPVGLEHLADVRDFAGGTHGGSEADAAPPDEIGFMPPTSASKLPARHGAPVRSCAAR
jgi:hypothetical protein